MNSRTIFVGKWIGAAALVAAGAVAQAVPVTTNGGFELGFTDWSPVGVTLETAAGPNTIGAQSARISPPDNPTNSLLQLVTLRTDHSYNLSFFVRRTTDGVDANGDPLVGLNPVLSVSLLGNAFSSFANIEERDPDVAGEIWFRYVTSNFNGPVAGEAGLAFSFSGTDIAYLDNVNMEDLGCIPGATSCKPGGGNGGNVPEPGSLLLVGASLAGLALVRRRKSN